MEREDLRIELAEDRELERLDREDRDRNGVDDRYEHGKFDVTDRDTRDELRMRFVEE